MGMRSLGGLITGTMVGLSWATVSWAQQPLSVVYPPDGHETTAEQIFLIGTAPPDADVTVNGQEINRSPAGHFAPSVPLQLGENVITLRQGDQELVLRVTRVSLSSPAPVGVAFAEGSLSPAVDVARPLDELVCFGAIAPPNALVSATLNNQTVTLQPQNSLPQLPPNSAVLTDQVAPISVANAQIYQGCTPGRTLLGSGVHDGSREVGATRLGHSQFRLELDGETVTQQGPGQVSVLLPGQPTLVEVTAASGTARTGPSTNFSRLTPLPTGTRAAVTAQEGEWYRLDYGAWIRASEVQVIPGSVPVQSIIRGVTARPVNGWTEVRFPLQTTVPVAVQQGDDNFTLTLYNTTAQTDTIFLSDDPAIARLDWSQLTPGQVQYRFQMKSLQQWGYKLRYEGTTLVLSLRHPPTLTGGRSRPLAGTTILIDPGHGSSEDLGARGPTGFPEKDVALTVSLLLRDRLVERGANVIMTREEDVDIYPNPRADQINATEPTLALSVHYNALPDSGDAENTAGIGTFWYHTQAHSLAMFLHNYLVERLDRPSYGVFWNNLALTRPAVAPSVLLELGFMINPMEFEWIVDEDEQERLAEALADGVVAWIQDTTP
ncbi:N-acetylmuramoyl-L-alanine amidase [Leptolyngbya sp. AN02str]|uniref:N-acetylmuramoyl-L-alanine amidase n=1 Tax=Leptolyngbya sp. AN02str TaxID=3423363 RepID=UPI003D316803